MYRFTESDVEDVYREMERRIEGVIADGDVENADDLRKDMLQGVYGTLMVLSSNWPEVRHLCDVIEEQYGYGY